jgi:hypothetical protein
MASNSTRRILAALGLGSAAIALFARPAPAANGASVAEGTSCVTFHAEPRAKAYGYDHWVLLDSTCDKTADCQVSSDVRKEPVAVAIEKHGHEEVNLWMNSPASSFVATVHCKLRD